MPVPIYTPGPPGGIVSGVLLDPGASCAAFLPAVGVTAKITVQVVIGAVAPTVSPVCQAWSVYGNVTPNQLQLAAATGSTSISVSSAATIYQGQSICLQRVGGAPRIGELVTINGPMLSIVGPVVTAATSSAVLPVTPLQNSYAAGDLVYLIGDLAPWVLTFGEPSTNLILPNRPYFRSIKPDPDQYVLQVTNGDPKATVTVNISFDAITAIQ